MIGAEVNMGLQRNLGRKYVLKMTITRFLSVILLLVSHVSYANDDLHATFNALLKQHVIPINKIDGIGGTSTQVDYAGFKASRNELTQYLKTLSEVAPATFNQWDKNTQLAFLINAYNAYTIELILTRYPDIDSIRDLGSLFSSPWKQAFAPLLGKLRTLDDIEHNLIRGSGRYNEPRIHFAVNCASVGCPALREEAYLGSKLDAQLEAQTLRFLADKTRNYYQDNTFYVSKIFSWYQDDFEMGWNGITRLSMFLLRYKEALGLSQEDVQRVENSNIDIEFLAYNWALNDVR